jgi:small-conductance mechanosensitive channel
MHSHGKQASVKRKPANPGGSRRGWPHATDKVALIGLLVVAGLLFVATANVAQAGPDQARMGALWQDTVEAPETTPQPPPTDAPTDEPQPPEDTAEPAPSDTPAPPAETSEPAPTNTSPPVTAPEKTTEPGTTVTPGATVPTATTPAPTPARRVSIWPTDLPLGTIHVGEESGPPAEPVRVTMGEWLRLAVALIVVSIVAILGGSLLHRLLKPIVTHQEVDVDEIVIEQSRTLLSWWLAAVGFQIAVWWVNFQNGPARALFADLTFLAYLGAATLTAWRLVDWAIDLYAMRISDEGSAATVERLRPLVRRWARILILVFSFLVGLGRFQGGFSVPTLLVMLVGLTISLAARDTLTDVIAGFSILIDQPFRIGDRIEVQGVETWATVTNIGLRTSVLLTRHHVEIIVPNSTIGENQVINYSYPDPDYRMQTHVGVAFGTNVEHARQVLLDAVRQAGYARSDALYVEIGDSAMIFRVRWWTHCYADWEKAYDRVHTALHRALAKAGIDSPFPSQTLNLEFTPEMADQVSRVIGGDGGSGGETTQEEASL